MITWNFKIVINSLCLSHPSLFPLGVCLCVSMYGCVCHVSSILFPFTIHKYLGILKHLIFPIGNTFGILTYLIYFPLVCILLYVSCPVVGQRAILAGSPLNLFCFCFDRNSECLFHFILLLKMKSFLINYTQTEGSPPSSPPIISSPSDLLSFCLSLDIHSLQ